MQKNTFRPWAATSLALLLAAGNAVAQPAPRPPPPETAGAAAAVASGTVQRLLVNPGGDVDGLLLADGTQVNFPPRPATGTPALRAGERVSVTGWRTPVGQVVRAASIRTGNGEASLIDGPPARGAEPKSLGAPGTPGAPRSPGEPGDLAGLVALNTSGSIVRLLYTDRGDANGALLDNGTVVRFPPHVGIALRDTLQPGRTLHARGWGSRTAAGTSIEANALGATAAMQDVLAGADAPARPPRAGRDRPPVADGARGALPPPVPAGDAANSQQPPPPPGQLPAN